MNARSHRRLLGLLLVAFVATGMTYALVIPPFEGPDEWSHISLVRYIRVYRTLPPLIVPPRRAASGPDVAWYLSYHDPPLYYAPPLYYVAGALLTFWTDMDDLPDLLVPSPSWEVGWAPEPGQDPWNKNLYAHRAEETLAQSDTVCAVYLLRLVSLCLGAVVVASAWKMARLLWPGRPTLALGAAAFVAFLPSFMCVSACVTNDSLMNALFALVLVGVLHCIVSGAGWKRWGVLGALVGLGLLTKQNALLLIPIGILGAVWQRDRGIPRWRAALVDGGTFLAAALAVGGWWYARNGLLYGDPLGLAPHFASQVPLERFGWREAWSTARAYWAAFGWAPITVAPWLYALAGLAALAALAGAAWSLRPGGPVWRAPRRTRRGLGLALLALSLNGAGFVRWAVSTGAPVARLLYPTLPVVGVCGAWGLAQWRHLRLTRWPTGLLSGLVPLFSLLIPWLYLRPAYAHPLARKGMPGEAQEVGASFEGGVQLRGYQASARPVRVNGTFQVTLYWQAERDLDRRYRASVQLGPKDAARYVAGRDVWLGGTLYPSELWRAGDTVRRTHRLSIPEWAPAPGLYWIRVRLIDETTGEGVLLADLPGDTVTLGPWRVEGPAEPPPERAASFRLEGGIRLTGYGLALRQEGGHPTLDVTLYWRADRAPEEDYAVFVHVVDREGRLIGQHDGVPRGGDYPPRGGWAGRRSPTCIRCRQPFRILAR